MPSPRCGRSTPDASSWRYRPSRPETCAEFADDADEFASARTPEAFYATGLWYLWYQDSTPTSDKEVRDLLANSAPGNRSRSRIGATAGDAPIIGGSFKG